MNQPQVDAVSPTEMALQGQPGTVWFVGAGPGDPELITVRGQRLIATADLVLYAGSLVPAALVASARADALVVDSAPLTLAATHALCRDTALAGGLVARVHTGDPGLYGAVQEQMRLLEQDGIPCKVVPGVTAAFAAAAAAQVSLTVPEAGQSIIITRMPGRTPVPAGERLRDLVRHGCTVAVYLSAEHADAMQAEFDEVPAHTPVLCAYRVSWPDERLIWATAGTLAETVRMHHLERQTVFLLMSGACRDGQPVTDTTSRLYDASFMHGFRPSFP